jgi:large subunit ribosomal protein L23
MVGGKVMELKIYPRVSEKTYAQAQTGMYVFDVPKRATKQQITNAVAKQYSVEVVGVNTIVVKGKVKKSYRKGGAPVVGRRKDVKKAYVRLAEGQSIPVFAEAEAAATDKTDEKAAKSSSREKK